LQHRLLDTLDLLHARHTAVPLGINHLGATNTYVVVAGSLALRNHLAVRDTLRASAALREEYGTAKLRAGATATDVYEYGAAKDAVVQRVLAAAGLSEEDRASIGANEVPRTVRRG
jgi:GrpB-like predicted nucleotidyltransferase (UPF0157 family)